MKRLASSKKRAPLAHELSIVVSRVPTVFGRDLRPLPGVVSETRQCAACGVFETRVLTELLGKPEWSSAIGVDLSQLVVGAMPSCPGVPL